MTDNDIENEIQKKGLTAPRITPDDLEKVIVSETYHVFAGSTFTACLLTLKNGYNLIGESACVSPENFNAEIGRAIARKNAVNKIWALEGYLLRHMLVNRGDHVMRAKLVVNSVDEQEEFSRVTFGAVCKSDGYDTDGSDENNTFSKFTPTADLDMVIQNPELIGSLQLGDEYYVDFTKAG